VLERLDATSSECMVACTSIFYGDILEWVKATLVCSVNSYIIGGGALLFGILSEFLHLDQYVPLHALIVTFLLGAQLIVDSCHNCWL
jgi:intracellular septation protein A